MKLFHLDIALCNLLLFSACSPQTIPKPTNTPQPTVTPQPTITPTQKPSPTPITYQTLGSIFPEGFDSAGVSANINTGSHNSENTHYDVAIPKECRGNSNNCPIISPVNGTVWEIYGLGDPRGSSGYVISINLSQPPEGIDKVLDQLNINPNSVNGYSIHLGHLVGINPDLKIIGAIVKKGMLLADGVNNVNEPEPKVAYVLYIKSSPWLQVSPCSVSNTASFCGVCYQYSEDCPETNINYPNGGIEWWNENDSFWETHKLSLP